MKCVVTFILLCFAIIAVCVGQTDLTEYTWPQDYFGGLQSITNANENYTFHSNQLVRGEGFHNSKQKIVTGQEELNNFGHGSGSLDLESHLIAFNDSIYSNILGDYFASKDYGIRMSESVDYVYRPTDFYFGKNFKSNSFRSKGAEKTCLKDYPDLYWGVGVSKNVRLDNSGAYSKDITADLRKMSWAFGYDDVNAIITFTNNSLATKTDFTGNLHIGAYQFKGVPQYILPSGNKNRFNVDKMIDEDYSGNFSITKRMDDTYGFGYPVWIFYALDLSPLERAAVFSALGGNSSPLLSNEILPSYLAALIASLEDNFLPCCFEGWNTMPPIYQRKFGKDTKGVFDCRCNLGYACGIDEPLIPQEAQFHNISRSASILMNNTGSFSIRSLPQALNSQVKNT